MCPWSCESRHDDLIPPYGRPRYTVVCATAVLFAVFGSGSAPTTVAVLSSRVPAGSITDTFMTTVNTDCAPPAKLPIVHTIFPEGVVQLQPAAGV